ncbi:MAG: hypothetical protein E7356_04030 [Clostridiales bacterium]|nr:hypothetical protein [Clostridiales bacterium]
MMKITRVALATLHNVYYGVDMELYLEYVIIDNLVMDYIILRLIELTIGTKLRKFNKVVVCLLGAGFAVFMPYIMKWSVLLFIYKIISSIVLVLCIKKHHKLRNFLTYYLLFFTYTFLVGGTVLGIINLLNIKYTMSSVIMYSFDFPMGLIGLVFIVVINIISRTIRVIRSKLVKSCYMYAIKIHQCGKCYNINGYLDTGNNVTLDNKGVIIISISLFLRIYKNIDLTQVLNHKVEGLNLNSPVYITIGGIGDNDKYLSFVLDEMVIMGKVHKSARVAVAMKNFGDYDCILHRDYLKEGA